ncbi:hypothetical protein M2163_004821 [Streptomyces sp. SAI-135]|uniref:toll/interleukin-1 receptor domain-containing protein n=1 Tax=unclassified Streptomyces TaxID=2593676 RepID=UPI0024772245|nr:MULTISPECIES: toll/interleukin-1 receptor domain-containing protein [unclassified Streptomyces]MDH6518196.1 hypothetical protein [Streptomyces sp. SAI-090]MDH6617713.1 hypothetical protein [Streptomyces sp. SAI-135]
MKIAFFLNDRDSTRRVMQKLADATTVAELGEVTFINPGDFAPRAIGSEIKKEFPETDVAVFDVTRARFHVGYMLGIAREAGVHVVLIAESGGEIPFDMASYRTLIYGNSLRDTKNLESALLQDLRNLQAEPSVEPSEWLQSEPKKAVFISYSHVDQKYIRRLLVHLRPLERQGIIDAWSDTRIEAGDAWREEIREALHRARIAILLISADFLASDFIVENELPPLLMKAEAEGTRILPVVVKACRFPRDPQLSRFQAVNDPKSPLAGMAEHQQEVIYDLLTESIERVIQ